MGDIKMEIVENSGELLEEHTKTIAFSWAIKDFKEFLEQETPIIQSPIFEHNEVEHSFKWQLVFKPKFKSNTENGDVEQVAMFLYLKTPPYIPVTASYQVELQDCRGMPWKKCNAKNVLTKSSANWGWSFVTTASLTNSLDKLLYDGALKIRCEVSIPGNENSIKRHKEYISNFSDMLTSQMFTDVSLETGTKIIKAHKAALSCRSSVFKGMFQSPMSETIDNIVKIPDFEYEVVYGMVQYIYSEKICNTLLLEKAVDLLQIADKYDVKGLKEISEEFMASNFSVQNISENLVVADTFNAMDLKAKAIKFLNKNKKDAMQTDGFKKMLASHKHLFVDLYVASE